MSEIHDPSTPSALDAVGATGVAGVIGKTGETEDTVSENVRVDEDTLRRASMAGLVGTMLENYDFAVYGTGAALVFNKLFFAGSSPAAALLGSFAIYGVGFVARPVGGLFFSHYGERIGRKFVLVMTLFLMGTATFFIGLLPTYDQVGVLSPLLLLVLRILQGFGAGAEQAGGIVLLTETAPADQRGRYASRVYVGAALGALLGVIVWWLIQRLLTPDQVASWGWRLVFLSSIFVTIAAYVFRRTLRESPVFEEAKARGVVTEREKPPVSEAFSKGGRGIARVFGLNIGGIAHSYFFQTFAASYLVSIGMAASTVLGIQAVANVCAAISAQTTGILSDRFGRRPMYLFITGFLVLFMFPAFLMFNTGNVFVVGLAVCVGYIFAVEGNVGVQSAWLPELFGARYRYAGVAMGRETSAAVGGFAPMIATWLQSTFHSWVPIAVFLVVMGLVPFVTALFAPETRGRDLLLEDDAHHGERRPVGAAVG